MRKFRGAQALQLGLLVQYLLNAASMAGDSQLPVLQLLLTESGRLLADAVSKILNAIHFALEQTGEPGGGTSSLGEALPQRASQRGREGASASTLYLPFGG